MELDAGAHKVNLEDLVDIVREAGRIILEIYGNESASWEVTFKADQSPVTLADKKANTYILERLQSLYPQIPIISEESVQVPYEERRNWEWFWCVDPLDGTKEFLKRNGQFTVNIGLCQGQSPKAGVVGVPVRDQVYFSGSGLGSHFRQYKGDKVDIEEKNLRVNKFDWNQSQLRVVGSRSHSTGLVSEFIHQFRDPEIILMGSSLKLCLVAHNKADLYPRLAPTSEWDTCAAHSVVIEAGGKLLQVTKEGNVLRDQPLIYNKADLLNPFFLVTGDTIITM
eukprot:Protomagalhaensia_wolfi_Nauph_80__5697@NODE_674_length_2140_cov_9_425512_g501_i0_p2_GENE_NODE_674_length_2140_cov_9_425512_g501_i0NODE_674_length_2140_cov_9_425512_g501_i0_p2_ORF_typecomplete_len302_score52_56Inositol_P/PF00459_25/1_3e56FBPase/PF00316_20/0_12_NODE_674_length_2140_cov_9_425512_g501_i064906